MLNKEEIRDGPFIIKTITERDINKNTMSPLDYVGLSGLSNSKNIKLDKLKNYADVIKRNVKINKNKIYESINLADIDKTIGEISNVNTVIGEEVLNSKVKFSHNEIIFGKIRPYLNNVAIVNLKPNKNHFFIGSSEWISVVPHKLIYYIFLVLRSKFTLFQTSASKGSVRPRYSQNKLPDLEIPIIKDQNLLLKTNSILKDIFYIRLYCNTHINKLINYYDSLINIKEIKNFSITYIQSNEINKNRMDANYYILNKFKKEIKNFNFDYLKNLITFSNKRVQERYKPGETFEYITTSDVNSKNGEIVHWEEKIYKPKYFVVNKAPDRAKMLLKENQILIPYLKLSLKSVAWVPKDLENYIGSNGFGILEAINNNYGFIYLSLRSKIVQNQLKLIAAGTIMEDISRKDLKDIVILLPEKDIKRAISKEVETLLNLRWRARKAYMEIISSFENYCSNIWNKNEYKEVLNELSSGLDSIKGQLNHHDYYAQKNNVLLQN